MFRRFRERAGSFPNTPPRPPAVAANNNDDLEEVTDYDNIGVDAEQPPQQLQGNNNNNTLLSLVEDDMFLEDDDDDDEEPESDMVEPALARAWFLKRQQQQNIPVDVDAIQVEEAPAPAQPQPQQQRHQRSGGHGSSRRIRPTEADASSVMGTMSVSTDRTPVTSNRKDIPKPTLPPPSIDGDSCEIFSVAEDSTAAILRPTTSSSTTDHTDAATRQRRRRKCCLGLFDTDKWQGKVMYGLLFLLMICCVTLIAFLLVTMSSSSSNKSKDVESSSGNDGNNNNDIPVTDTTTVPTTGNTTNSTNSTDANNNTITVAPTTRTTMAPTAERTATPSPTTQQQQPQPTASPSEGTVVEEMTRAPVVSTSAPTTSPPTRVPTSSPTTLAPTSLAPTTLAPTTLTPTTLAPTTMAPTTLAPTTWSFSNWVSSFIWTQTLVPHVDDEMVITETTREFGTALALSQNGNVLAVSTGPSIDGQSGQVYVFEYGDTSSSTWQHRAVLDEGEQGAISMNRDGSVLALSDPKYSAAGFRQGGRVRVFLYNGNYIPVGQELLGDADIGYFGASLALSSRGFTLVVGASFYTDTKRYQGQVRVYEYDLATNLWLTMGQPLLGSNQQDWFGSAVALFEEENDDGEDRLLIAASATHDSRTDGYVNVYEYVRDEWKQLGSAITNDAASSAFIGDYFGYALSLTKTKDDSFRIAIGAPYKDDPDSGMDRVGMAVVYELPNKKKKWEIVGEPLWAENTNDKAGFAVSLVDDGELLLVGAPGANESRGSMLFYEFKDGDEEGGSTALFEPSMENPSGIGIGEDFGVSVSATRRKDKLIVAVGALQATADLGEPGYVAILEEP